MNKKLAFAILFIQIFITLCFILPATSIKQNNSVATFMVNSVETKLNHEVFSKNFPQDESTILSIELNEITEENLVFAEDILSQLISEPGVVHHHTFLLDTPHSLRFQLLNELGWEKGAKELVFPFIRQNFYTSIVLLCRDNEKQQTAIANIVKKIPFFIHHYPQIKDIVFAGEPVVGYYLGQSSLEVKTKFFPTLLVFCSCVMLWVFRSIKVLMAWLLAFVNALVVSMGMYSLMGNSLNLITNLIPILIFVLSTAMHMHILLSLTHSENYVVGLREKLIPNFLVALTTSIGFGSLMVSNVKPIYLLGKYTSFSIWIIFVSCYITHLGFSRLFALDLYNKKLHGKGIASNKLFHLGKMPGLLLILPVLIIAFGLVTVIHNSSESNGLKYFSPNHTIRENTEQVQQNITGTSNVELLIPKPSGKWLDIQFYNKITLFEEQLTKLEHVRHVISLNQYIAFANKSAIGFSSYDEEELIVTKAETLQTIQTQIAESSEAFRFLVSDDYYRIQVLCNSIDSDRFNALKKKITHLYQQQKFDGTFIFTGTLDQVIQIQMYLLQSMGESLLLTITLSLLLMTLFLRNLHIIYLAIIPNLFPLGCMASSLVIFAFPTTIGTVMVFSIAFGIAVDSTIHLFHSFYHAPQQNFANKWTHSLQMNSSAIWITSVILFGAFLLIGLLSSFLPTTQFGVLLAIGMISAWLGDVSFLPISLRLYER